MAPPSPRVLLCVDDQRTHDIFAMAATGAHAVVAEYADGVPDVLVTDWPPPLRAQHMMRTADRRLEVVAVVDDGDVQAADAAMDRGVTDCIMQPLRAIDVSMRLHAALRRARERSALDHPGELIDALPNGLVVMSPQGRISQVNRAFARIAGVPAGQLVGLSVAQDSLLGPDPARVAEVFRRAREAQTAEDLLTLRTVRGEQPVAVRISALRDDLGTVSAYLMSARTPTERERAHVALHRIASAARSESPTGTFGRLAAEVVALVQASAAVVMRSDALGQLVLGSVGAVIAGTRLDADMRVAANAAVPCPDGFERISVPMQAGGRTWGQMVACVPAACRDKAEQVLQPFAGLAAMIAIDADVRGAHEDDRDHLTGLPGNRAYTATLQTALADARANRTPVSVVVCDVDNLKRINDLHGHVAGDRVLQDLAMRIAGALRPGDVLARTAGEEFAWLLVGADAATAVNAARAARRAIAEHPVAGVGSVTASFGIAQFPVGEGVTTPLDLMRQAEVALQWAQMGGGNRCVPYSFEVAEEVFARSADLPAEAPNLRAMRALAWAVDARDPHTQRHSGRVADLVVRIATVLGWTAERTVQLREAGLVHDVGKISVPDAVLFKPGPLTAAEFAIVKRHAAVGARIVADVLSPEQASWVRGHHERLDGTGYPDGLAGDAIPEEARVLAVADSWDVMVSTRSYKDARSTEDAMAEMVRCTGTQFWPPAVEALRCLVEAGILGEQPLADADEITERLRGRAATLPVV